MARIRSIHPEQWSDKFTSAGASCYLYIIQEGDHGPLKVGISRNPLWRRQDLQSGNYRQLNIRAIYSVDTRAAALNLESAALENFIGDRLGGEWLDVPLYAAISFLSKEVSDA